MTAMRMSRTNRRGSAMLEFMLVGIPMMFVLISIFEIARGMWIYETLSHAVREGTRFAIVHGNTCALTPNSCVTTVGGIATRMRDAGVGLLPENLTVTITSTSRSAGPATLATLLTDTTPFPSLAVGATPPDPGGETGLPVTITASYPFESAIVMFWPGATGSASFTSINLPATSRANIQF
jgi:Flp pilus assembly protein TadG